MVKSMNAGTMYYFAYHHISNRAWKGVIVQNIGRIKLNLPMVDYNDTKKISCLKKTQGYI